MKKALIIFISILIVVLAGLFLFFKYQLDTANKNITVLPAPADTQKTVTLLNNSSTPVECKFFPDIDAVVQSNNIKGCDCLSADLKGECLSNVRNNALYLQAYKQLDPALCNQINYDAGKNFCLKEVNIRIASAKNNPDNLLLTYLFNNNYDEAIKLLENTIKAKQTIAKNFYFLAQSYANKALAEHSEAVYIPKALAMIEQAKVIEPNNPEVYKTEGYVYEIKPDLNQAVLSYEKALTLDPNYIPAFTSRGHTKEMLGDSLGALRDFNQAAALDKDQKYIYTYSNLCRINLYLNNPEASINACTVVISSSLASADAKSEAHQILGSTYSAIGKYDQALIQFRVAETFNPNDINLMISMANMFARQGDAIQAEIYARKAVAADPSRAMAYENLAASLMSQQKYAEAITTAQKALSLVPVDVSVLSGYKNDVKFRVYSILAEVYKGTGDSISQIKYEALANSLN